MLVDQLDLFIRAVTFVLGMLPMIFAGAVADRIMVERSKKTWESLLTTPLTGAEILSSKMRVAARYIWTAARGLIPLWLLGIVCGGVASARRPRGSRGPGGGHLAGPGDGRPGGDPARRDDEVGGYRCLRSGRSR